jgi:hypothetical protein
MTINCRVSFSLLWFLSLSFIATDGGFTTSTARRGSSYGWRKPKSTYHDSDDTHHSSIRTAEVGRRTPSSSSSRLQSLAVPTESLKSELFALSRQTNRGFQAKSNDRARVQQLINELTILNPTREPARAYYDVKKQPATESSTSTTTETSAAGKWTLIYTDAPDITGLQRTSPFLGAELGRIGQNCDPPFIENVIEWIRPTWLPDVFGGPDRILQKVVTKGVATTAAVVDLSASGIRLEPGASSSSSPWQLPPLDLSNGLFTLPFGRFQILYLDDELRIVRTGQNFVAVNRRLNASEEWF